MDPESQSNVEENDEQSKQDAIKERLKEMGVAQDSVRPEKSWFAKFGKFVLLLVIGVLIGAYWYEAQRMGDTGEESMAQTETPANAAYPSAYGYDNRWTNQPPPAPWMQAPATQQENVVREDSANTQADNYNQQNSYWSNQRAYPGYSQPYRPNYGGYYSAPVPPQGYAARNDQQRYSGNYQMPPPAYRYPNPYDGQTYYNGWQR